MDSVPKNPDLPDPEKDGNEYIKTAPVFAMKMDKNFKVKTIEGDVEGKAGDYLCKGANGEYWPIDSKVFDKTYKNNIKEDAELHDDDKFGDEPIASTSIYVSAPDSKVVSDAKLRLIFMSGIQAYIDKVTELGGEPDWDGVIEWYIGDHNYFPNLVAEGLSPLSHDNSIQRKIRKHKTPRARRHMKGSDRYRRTDPVKRVKARLKRDSRHQPKPEVEEAFSFIAKYVGKPITESDLQNIGNIELFADSIDLLSAMAFGGWSKTNDGISNGRYVLENENLDINDGQLIYNKLPLKLNWDWLYSVKQLVDKRISDDNRKSWTG